MTDQATPQPAPTPAPAPTPKPVSKAKKKFPLKLYLILGLLSSFLFFLNTYVMTAAGAEYILNLLDSLGGWGVLAGILLPAGVVFLFPPLFAWSKARQGPALAWTLTWNVAFLGVFIGFAPIKLWFQHHGALPPALILGEEAWLVQKGFVETLGWGIGELYPNGPRIPPGSEPFVERSNEILTALKSARSLDDLKPVVADSNLQTVSTWSERKQLLAVRHVNNKIELLDLDVETLKSQWQLKDFEQTETTALLTWKAPDPEGGKGLMKQLKLVKEGEEWKADFAADIEEFDRQIRERDGSEAEKPSVQESPTEP